MLNAIEILIAASEREYLCDDEPDDSDISHPPSGITMGMIRAARVELDALRRSRGQHLTTTEEYHATTGVDPVLPAICIAKMERGVQPTESELRAAGLCVTCAGFGFVDYEDDGFTEIPCSTCASER